jgi:hypothetical protein
VDSACAGEGKQRRGTVRHKRKHARLARVRSIHATDATVAAAPFLFVVLQNLPYRHLKALQMAQKPP